MNRDTREDLERSALSEVGESEVQPTIIDGPGAFVPTQLTPASPGPGAAPGGPASGKLSGRVLGKFTLLAELGSGGMGTVYKAYQNDLSRVVALKTLHGATAAGSERVERFLREARSAARLDHPGIVRVYEVGEEAGVHYFTMDYVEGTNLLDRVAAAAPPLAERVRWVRDAGFAVHHAHEKGVVHRDLKPQNVMIDGSGAVKVTDFGLAWDASAAKGLTVTGVTMGTPAYMSPEQARGEWDRVGPLSDVYSLGATLYHVIAGAPPVQGPNSIGIVLSVSRGDLVPLRARAPHVPRDLDTIVAMALELDRARRYPSARAFAEDLGRFLSFEAIHARPLTWWEAFARRLRRNWKRTAIAGALGAALLGNVAVFLVWRGLAAERLRAEEQRERAEEEERMARAETLYQQAKNPAYVLEREGTQTRKELLAEAVRAYPGLAKGHLELGVAREASGDIEGALRSYEDALREDPGFVMAKARLAILSFYLEPEDGFGFCWERGEDLLDELEAESAGDPETELVRCYRDAFRAGDDLVRLGEARTGLEALAPRFGEARLLLAGVSAGFHYHPARTWRFAAVPDARDMDRALYELQALWRADPLDLSAQMNLALIWYELGDYPGAEEGLRSVARSAPRWWFPPYFLARLFFLRRRAGEAREWIERSVALDRNEGNLRVLAISLAHAGKFPEALEIVDEALALNEGDETARTLRAMGLHVLGREAEAKEEIRAVFAEQKYMADVRKMDELLSSQAMKPLVSSILVNLREFPEILVLKPQEKGVVKAAFALLDAIGRLDELKSALLGRSDVSQEIEELLLHEAEFRREAPDLARATAWFVAEMGLSTEPELLFPLLQFFFKLGRDEELLARAKLGNIEDLLWRAGTHYRRKDFQKARSDLEAALAMNRACDKAWYGLATILALEGESEACANALREARRFGFGHLEFVLEDPDFAGVREAEEIRAVLDLK
ncbi:MAG: protein kinase [Planctomycetes bacterium]|nr:protein kinase [Planctomycetota bacterium]